MGKLIVFEGIDGSGKSTQLRLLCERLAAEGRDFRKLTFPRYDNPSSALLRMYLAGEFGSDPADVNAYAASTFYAVDRYASWKQDWGGYYESGGVLLADRYTTSNAIHQAAKLPAGERESFFRWLYDFEFRLMGLPAPDAVFYMDVSVAAAERQMRSREAATHTAGDIHETHHEYLAGCRAAGLAAAGFYGWERIECERDGAMRPIAEIQEEICGRVFARLS